MWKQIGAKYLTSISKCVGEFDVYLHGILPGTGMTVKTYEAQDGTFTSYTQLLIRRSFDNAFEGGVGFGNTVESSLEDALRYFVEMVDEDYPNGLQENDVKYICECSDDMAAFAKPSQENKKSDTKHIHQDEFIKASLALGQLNGEELTSINRAGDMITFSFGEDINFVDSKGISTIRPHYSLNVQCPWNIVKQNRVLLGSYDFYITPEGNTADDDKGDSIIDAFLKSYYSEDTEFTVEKITLASGGSLHIEMTGQLSIHILIHSSYATEFWRLIDFDKQTHYVMFEDVACDDSD